MPSNDYTAESIQKRGIFAYSFDWCLSSGHSQMSEPLRPASKPSNRLSFVSARRHYLFPIGGPRLLARYGNQPRHCAYVSSKAVFVQVTSNETGVGNGNGKGTSGASVGEFPKCSFWLLRFRFPKSEDCLPVYSG